MPPRYSELYWLKQRNLQRLAQDHRQVSLPVPSRPNGQTFLAQGWPQFRLGDRFNCIAFGGKQVFSNFTSDTHCPVALSIDHID